MAGNDQDNKDARVARRLKVLKAGKILVPGNLSVVDCTIRDISDTGARVVVGDQAAVPSEFRFIVLMDNTIRDAKAVWRRGDLIGLTFTSEAKRAPPRKW